MHLEVVDISKCLRMFGVCWCGIHTVDEHLCGCHLKWRLLQAALLA